jgi:hypothetical protein
MRRRVNMKVKKFLRSIMCMLVAICVSFGLFGSVPVKAGGWSDIEIQLPEGESKNVIAGETRHLTVIPYSSYYDDNDNIVTAYGDAISSDELTWSVSVGSGIATVSEDGVVTFSSDITSQRDVTINVSYGSGYNKDYINFTVAPKYKFSNTVVSLKTEPVNVPELKEYSIGTDGNFQTTTPDNITLKDVTVADTNVVTVSNGIITPVSTKNGDRTTCTATYTDGTNEFNFSFTCTISNPPNVTASSEVNSEIAGNITDDKLYIYGNDNDLQTYVEMFKEYYPQYADLIVFKNLNMSRTSDEYINGIQSAVASTSEPASLFTLDVSSVTTFAAKDYVVPLSEIGYKDSWTENTFDFTRSWGSVDGKLTALAYDACPGLFYYNTEIAEDVFGTSDPDKIQALVKDWDTFKETAKKLADKGYYTLSSANDMMYVALNSADAIVSDGTYYLGGTIKECLENAIELTEAGCLGDGVSWSNEWQDNMTNGKVFAYFGTSWFDNTMTYNGATNMYKVCEGPAAYYWGGSYISATTACKNTGLAQLFLYTITADETFTKLIPDIKGSSYPNNKVTAKALADEGSLGTYYTTTNSPYSALYNNAVKLQIPEAYAEKEYIYDWLYSILYDLSKKQITTLDDAMTILSDAIKNYDSNAVISTEAPPVTHKHTLVTDAAVAATCGKDGLTEGSHCSTCNKVITAQKTIPATGNHDYSKTSTTAATTTKDGKTVKTCSVCGNTVTTATIYKAKTVKLAKTTYTYTGKAIKPSVTVKDSKGKAIDKSNYTVTYPSSCKNVGTYTVTIKFKGNYSGTKKLTYTIQPKATKLSSVKAGSKSFTAKWSKQKTQTTGYQIQYSTSSKFTKATTKTVKKNSTTSLKVSKLTKGKKYYVRIRTYKTVKVNGKNKNIYSSWSSAKKVTVK